jgi:hypothetical protein
VAVFSFIYSFILAIFNFKMAKTDVYRVSGYKLDIASSTPFFLAQNFALIVKNRNISVTYLYSLVWEKKHLPTLK